MFNSTDISSLLSYSKNLLTDQTETGLIYSTGSPVFNATYGHGISTATSIITLITTGGFDNQRVTGVMRYRSPSTYNNAQIGVIARYQTNEQTALTDYYFARVDNSYAKITKVVGTVFITMSSAIFPLPADTDVTIIFTVVGSYLSATFTASGVPTVTLGAIDSLVPSSGLNTGNGGLMGYRTLTTAGYCSSIKVEQL